MNITHFHDFQNFRNYIFFRDFFRPGNNHLKQFHDFQVFHDRTDRVHAVLNVKDRSMQNMECMEGEAGRPGEVKKTSAGTRPSRHGGPSDRLFKIRKSDSDWLLRLSTTMHTHALDRRALAVWKPRILYTSTTVKQ